MAFERGGRKSLQMRKPFSPREERERGKYDMSHMHGERHTEKFRT